MSLDNSTPRVFIYRHGETEWTKNGRYTGVTDLSLTAAGRSQVVASGNQLVGPKRLIDPSNLARVYISPRKRAYETFELAVSSEERESLDKEGKVKAAEERLAEWDYGLYEGLVTKEIRQGRKSRGLDGEKEWDIWRDGCEDGESAHQVTDRLDALISEIQSIQAPNMHGEHPCDIVLFAHGHLLRALVKRWLKLPLDFSIGMMLEPGGVGILSYQHHNVKEPALHMGLSFPTSQ